MSFVKKVKKALATLAIAVFIGTFFVSGSASADCFDSVGAFGSCAGDLFSSGEEGISFTQYEGQLAELSTEGYDPALVVSTDLRDFVITIVNFALGFLGLIAVIIVIYGGVLYVTAAGEEEKTQTGKKAITYAVIGLLIILGSFAFVNTVIRGATGGSDANGNLTGATGAARGRGFNAAAEQVRALAVDIMNGFIFLEESTEELKNIKNDAQKESLLPDNFPAKGDILAYMQSLRSKLNNLKSRMQPFSVAEARINELLREVDTEIDSINRLNTKRYMGFNEGGLRDAAQLQYCDIDKERSFWEGAFNATDEEICRDAELSYNIYYIEGLYEIWSVLQPKYAAEASGETTLYDLVQPISADYLTDLNEIFTRLDEILASYLNIQVIKEGRTSAAYEEFQRQFGYSVSADGNITQGSSGAMSEIARWNLDSGVDVTGRKILAALEQQSIMYKELLNIEFVEAHLTANVIEGSAPLPVIFDILGSVDPAGGSIKGESVTWDLAGKLSLSDFMNGEPVPEDSTVQCSFPSGVSEEELIGNTSKRCLFTVPGTYTAQVRIDSNEPTKFAPGISILLIKVLPPTTKIELTVEAAGQEQVVMHYEDDVLVTDRQSVTLTVSDAESGITFDASATDAERYKIDFGDGEATDFQAEGVFEHSYKEPGRYEVALEVINRLGIADKKIFTLEISSIAARLSANPSGVAFVNASVLFDASASKSDLGDIINFDWEIQVSPDQVIPIAVLNELSDDYPVEKSGSTLQTITHEFRYPLNYDISVEVTDDASNKDKATLTNYRIESQPPVAQFDYEIPDPTQPGTVHFDAGSSYDPDIVENFEYQWTITPETGWRLTDAEEHGLDAEKPIVKFLEKGDYTIILRVTDSVASEEYSEATQTISIDNVLDVAFADDQKVTFILDDEGQAEVEFDIVSDNAVAYEINFGNDDTDTADINSNVSYIYTEAGKYLVQVTVYDEEDNGNTLQRKIFIGGGDKPVAKGALRVNGDLVVDLSQPVKVSKNDVLTFDAGESKNTDGTGRDLTYSWDFGDTKQSSQKNATHSYKEVSPLDPGYYEVTLNVSDSKDVSKSDDDEFYIDVINMPPKFDSVQGTLITPSREPVTPVTMNMKAFGVEDVDGEVTQYKWWYYDFDDPDEPLGIQITDDPIAQLLIGTRGKDGQQIKYGFGLEITDAEGATYSNMQAIEEKRASYVTVTNGPNALPTSKFNVDATAVLVGDTVTFTSASDDPDGNIISYVWDLEGDGFYNNIPTSLASIEHIYQSRNTDGYAVRLKVVDDKGGETVSDPISIYVDSLAEPPVAAFSFEVVDGSNGMKIKFFNNSTTDESAGARILSYKWDFDTKSTLKNVDSNGDGVLDNDTDSQARDPERLYTQMGEYSVKLTVTDSQGNTDDVVNKVLLPLANPPVAAFNYEIVDGQVVFTSNSTADEENGAHLEKFIWDFDVDSKLITADTDGDGSADNDKDSDLESPAHKYAQTGIYNVKLTVVDNQGNSDDVVRPVDFAVVAPDPTETDPDDTTNTAMVPVLTSSPAANAEKIIVLTGESGSIEFDFSKSQGAIAYYIFDKNIHFDTDGNGVKTDDKDFKTSLPGRWTTNFEKAWGKTVVKLTVVDIYGNENQTTLEVQFN